MKLTGWYREGQKPVRVGVYQRLYGNTVLYCYWNGSSFGFGYAIKRHAFVNFCEASLAQNLPWRGVAK